MSKRGNRFIDRTGKVFGDLTVIRLCTEPRDSTAVYYWICLCVCGATVRIAGSKLTRRQSCAACASTRNPRYFKHGMYKTSTYKSWYSMVSRCSDKNNKQYSKYGGRGIFVCPRWKEFSNFLEDMGLKPDETYSIDRIDNNQGYYKENCRWASKREQARNRRNNTLLTIDDVTKTLVEWSESSTVCANAIRRRLKAGWEPREAVFAPNGTRKGTYK